MNGSATLNSRKKILQSTECRNKKARNPCDTTMATETSGTVILTPITGLIAMDKSNAPANPPTECKMAVMKAAAAR